MLCNANDVNSPSKNGSSSSIELPINNIEKDLNEETLLFGLISKKCYDTVLSTNFQNMKGRKNELITCAKQFISKGLSYGIIAGSSLLKVDQIRKIIVAGAVTGFITIIFLLRNIQLIVAI